MTCPACKCGASRVVDKRAGVRRRECRKCGVRWNTTEVFGPGVPQPARKISKKPKSLSRSWIERIEEKLKA